MTLLSAYIHLMPLPFTMIPGFSSSNDPVLPTPTPSLSSHCTSCSSPTSALSCFLPWPHSEGLVFPTLPQQPPYRLILLLQSFASLRNAPVNVWAPCFYYCFFLIIIIINTLSSCFVYFNEEECTFIGSSLWKSGTGTWSIWGSGCVSESPSCLSLSAFLWNAEQEHLPGGASA